VSGEGLEYRLLGPLEVERSGQPVRVGGAKARAVLAMLVLDANRVVSTTRLIEGVWGEDPPDGAGATLQVHVSNLRKALGPGALETRAPGYLLDVPRDAVDVLAFDDDLSAARALKATGDLAAARSRIEGAIARWRGAPLADLLDAPFAEAAVPWLEERRALAVEEHGDLLIESGAHRDAVAELESALGRWPHRERLWGQLMLALYRSGRQADALAAYQRARRTLGDDLGIDPGPELRRLEAQVLAQDPALDLVDAPAAEPNAASPDVDDPGATYRAPVQRNCRLELENGDELTLEAIVSIGRHPDCTITLADTAVSRRHAELRPALGGHLLVDLGSTNGTLVNGVPVVQHLLGDGDVIGVGAHQLRYRSDPS